MQQRDVSARALWALIALSGCATYRPDPIDPARVLESLEACTFAPYGSDATGDGPGDAGARAVGPRQLAAFAVSTSPTLAAARAEIGVRRALLVEAGLLPDPTFGWDAMDVLAARIADGSSSSVDVLAGFGLIFPLLRPGERAARVDVAGWRTEEARRRVAAAEWSLTRDVHVAYEEVRVAERLADETRALTRLSETTHDYFERAREAGAATAVQANLALGELLAMRLQLVRADARANRARQALNALVGLPPATDIALRAAADPSTLPALASTPEELTRHALDTRPDLAELLARYQASEEDVRLAVTKRFPALAIGTGFSLTLPVFSRFAGPEIDTALARREELRRAFTAAVHATRQEIASLHVLWTLAQSEVELVEGALLPNAEQSLELSRAALREGEVTLLETLALQRALVAARTQSAETRAERSKRAWELLAASGWLLAAHPLNDTDREVPR